MRLVMLVSLLLAPSALAQEADTLGPRQARFLARAIKGETHPALLDLFKGSLIPAAKLPNLAGQIDKGIKLYGGAIESRIQPMFKPDSSLAYGGAIVTCENTPLFFYFIWYRPKADAEWRIINFWFNDQAKDFHAWIRRK